ncbi:hypothetical protein DFQ01_108142 [Paenibacillus cellulosilyticus]|uniref:Uncharacterized protein n=1 Tax=Paenibacillus cellulosilyticus TaxID=375489 RepID=A0A2V2YTW4_9BACL|nr:hypothetical protein DFQ01_108142 [Paenibacillus cellulosilyticus]
MITLLSYVFIPTENVKIFNESLQVHKLFNVDVRLKAI